LACNDEPGYAPCQPCFEPGFHSKPGFMRSGSAAPVA